MKKSNLIILFLIALITGSCNNNLNEVVVYTTVDQIFSEPILKDFEKESGIVVKAVYDTEETKSTGVLNRLIAEKDNPQCDLFWSGDPVRTIVLKNKGITSPYQSAAANDIDVVFKDPDNHWTGFSARARVLIYNKNLLEKDHIPQSIFDLTKEKFKGEVAIANPLFGTTTFHIAALFTAVGNEKAKQFLTDLKSNQVVIASSNGDVKKRVVQGEVSCGLTDTDDAFAAILEGEPVDMIFLDQDIIGSLIMPNTVSLIANSPNPDNGKKLIEYLLEKQTESKLAHLCAQIPLREGVRTPKYLPAIKDIRPMSIDYSRTAIKMEEIQPFIKNWIKNW